MFGSILKGTRTKKAKKMRAFGTKDTSRWKKQGSPASMVSFRKLKTNKWWG